MAHLAATWPQFETTFVTVTFWLMWLIGVMWLKRHRDLAAGRREPVLAAGPAPAAGEPLPKVTMLIAAKDEEANIGRCGETLLKQDYPRLEIIFINDRSSDRTAEIIDGLAARDPRVRAIHIRDLPEGWFGKNHAMHVGVQQAGGEWLCFSDADCTYHSPGLITAAVRCAQRDGVEFLSVLPRLEAVGFWERVIQPVNGAIMVYWHPPQLVNDPRRATAYANGAFMLMPRTAYERLGGHEPVKATLNEDMHLARRAKALGLKLRVIRGGDLYDVRMYRGFRQVWRGWARIFYGCLATPLKLIVSLLLLFLSTAPTLVLLAAPLLTANWGWLMGAAGFAVLAQQSVLWPMYGLMGNGSAWALTYPIGSFLSFFITLDSLGRVWGLVQTNWRGTRYKYGAHAR